MEILPYIVVGLVGLLIGNFIHIRDFGYTKEDIETLKHDIKLKDGLIRRQTKRIIRYLEKINKLQHELLGKNNNK